jgi:7-carboxy-7-deazaguanine synthase
MIVNRFIEENVETYLINSIYLATEGEGIHVGTPQIFVRFQGCHIGCLNCDSMDTWSFEEGELWSLDSILEEIHVEGKNGMIKRVSITGGDPLHPKHLPAVYKLSEALRKKGYYINIEAAGTRIDHKIFDLLDFISFDFKTPSTGVKTNPALIKTLLEQYQGRFQIKAVIENEKDFDATYEAYKIVISGDQNLKIDWCLTPAYNCDESFPQKRFERILELNEQVGGVFRVIGQQHKWVYGPNLKQV